MIYELLTKLDKKYHFLKVSAHSESPCKVYDPVMKHGNLDADLLQKLKQSQIKSSFMRF